METDLLPTIQNVYFVKSYNLKFFYAQYRILRLLTKAGKHVIKPYIVQIG